MKITIELVNKPDCKNELWQWDTGRKVKITKDTGVTVDEVHFSNVFFEEAFVVLPSVDSDTGEITADIPNILLQYSAPLSVYMVMHHEKGEWTICEHQLRVKPRRKPQDYVYTETEVHNYITLNKQIKVMDKEVVKHVKQELTEEQKNQARKNIGFEDATVEVLVALNIAPVILDENGAVLTDENDALLLNM